jgi:predicted nuclease of predicted toxin-antitoxin system
VRYLLDEDLPGTAAEIARGLGLDAVSVHEIGRRGLTDPEQFAFATEEGRIMVTRNRDDFRRLVVAAFEASAPSPGVLVVPRSLPNNAPAQIAHALQRWHQAQAPFGDPGYCFFSFLS